MTLTRRTALLAGAALPLLGLARPGAAQAQAAAPGAALPLSQTFTVGDVQVTALLAGSAAQEDPHEIFGLDVDDETFERVSAENFVPADRVTFFFHPALVRTGERLVLFDTGLGAPGLVAALADAGVAPADVTHMALTHMHPDHIGGLTDDAGQSTFPNAAYLAGRIEFDHWAAQGNELFEAKVRPFSERMSFVEDGQEAAGVTAMLAAGHTPGHMAFLIDGGSAQMMITADTANHYVWSLAHPDWEVRFDADPAAAAATRRRVLGMIADERMPMLGYHMPFPAVGYVERDRGDGFRWVPHSYQLL